MESILKIGDKVHYTLFGGEQGVSTITGIEICKQDEKYGRAVKSCHINKHHGVVNLNNGHWCYFDQIIQIIPILKNKRKRPNLNNLENEVNTKQQD